MPPPVERGIASALCPYCDYELAGLLGDRCPECGQAITREDVRLDARRRVFLDLTRWRVWVWNGVVLLLVMYGTFGLGAIAVGLAIGSAWLLPRGRARAGLVRRVQRRVWLLSIWWLQAPWLVLGLVPVVVNWVYWNTSWLDWIGDWAEIGYHVIRSPFGGAVLLAVHMGAILVWRRRLRSLGRAAGIGATRADDPFSPLSGATILAVCPIVAPAMWTALVGLFALLDNLYPNWGTGF